jgi:hypothetical protein
MDDVVQRIRAELLEEAIHSPGLLRDLANLERYIGETYSNRTVIELLQNADDAEALRFSSTLTSRWFVCANDGRDFSERDFYALCRSAASDKQRGAQIGYRGIGFKSVVRISNQVHLLSGSLKATFSRELTQRALGFDIPTPLVRIPHLLQLPTDNELSDLLLRLESERYTTVFVFDGLDRAAISEELDQFESEYLLFLHHLTEARLSCVAAVPTSRVFSCRRTPLRDRYTTVQLTGPSRSGEWELCSYPECEVAFALVDGRRVALDGPDALAHAFLPTLEPSGFGVRVNADFSTDPSRTRIVLDERTRSCITRLSQALAALILTAAFQSGDLTGEPFRALVPTVDLATLSLQRPSLGTELVAAVREQLANILDGFVVRPSWLNLDDTVAVAEQLGKKLLNPSDTDSARVIDFLRYAGVSVLSPESVLQASSSVLLSESGRVELAARFIANAACGRIPDSLRTAQIWTTTQGVESLETICSQRGDITPSFLSQLEARGVKTNDLAHIATALCGKERSRKFFGRSEPAVSSSVHSPDGTAATGTVASTVDPLAALMQASQSKANDAPRAALYVPAWCSAEQAVTDVLQQQGYTVEDRSRQNLGYDLYAYKEPSKYYLEVKLLNFPGQPFSITSNEEAVARECHSSYALVLVLKRQDRLEMQFIRNPAVHLQFVRQCRNWVWECAEYFFESSITVMLNK